MAFGDYNRSNRDGAQNKGLLAAGWRPLSRDLNLGFLWNVLWNDPGTLTKKSLDLLSDIADATGRREFSPLANFLNLFSDHIHYEFNEFWNFITPEPAAPDHRHKETLSVQTPVVQMVSRDSIPIDYVLNRLEEIAIMRILEIMGKPDLITQCYWERHFYLPPERFTSWERLEVMGSVAAYWRDYDVWLQIETYDRGKRNYNLYGNDLTPLVNKATYNLAVILSGYKSRVGQVFSQYPLNSFPTDVQAFTDTVQQAAFDRAQMAVLISGEPGTGKTAWTQAFAKEVMVPLGYTIFILDHDAVENFVPPVYLEKICLIINEADNLAKNRAFDSAQDNNKTEHILSLLDGTLYQSVIDENGVQMRQKLVVLMTCNTTERMDPALLRKGRVDYTHEFTQKFV
jgi:hypothetical protein